MKKAITILALIMMIFAVSCSNDTPAPANEVPVKEDITVDTPALPETPGNLEDVVDLFTVISALTTADEAVVDEWTNYYNEAGEKVATLVDGDTYLTIDGDVLRAGDKVIYYPGYYWIEVNDVRYTTSTEQGRQYIEDINDLMGSVVSSVESSDVEKVFTYEYEVPATEPEGEPTTASHTITVTGTKRAETGEPAEEHLDGTLEYSELNMVIAPAYGDFTTVKLNVYDKIEPVDVEEGEPVPDPATEEVRYYVLTVGDTIYDVSIGADVIEGVLTDMFN